MPRGQCADLPKLQFALKETKPRRKMYSPETGITQLPPRQFWFSKRTTKSVYLQRIYVLHIFTIISLDPSYTGEHICLQQHIHPRCSPTGLVLLSREKPEALLFGNIEPEMPECEWEWGILLKAAGLSKILPGNNKTPFPEPSLPNPENTFLPEVPKHSLTHI